MREVSSSIHHIPNSSYPKSDFPMSLFSKLLFWIVTVLVLHGYESKGCIQKEKFALLQIKNHLNSILSDTPNKPDVLPSWNEERAQNCCSWEGVTCDPLSGHVFNLSLVSLLDSDFCLLFHEPASLNMTVFQDLEQLRSLGLSNLCLTSLKEEKAICRMRNLQVLDLSWNGINAGIPDCIGRLNNLVELDISSNRFTGNIPSAICRMRNLQVLDLSENGINSGISDCIGRLNNLVGLHISSNGFTGNIPSDVVGSVFDLGELKETRNGVFYLDFYLMNERRNTIKTTVWGSLAEQLSKRRDDPAASYVILLPAMNVRDYKGVTQLSSTSGTAIYDSLDIPEVFNLTQLLLNQAAPIQDIHRTLLQLLEMGREQFEVNNVASTTVRCLATVVAIHPRSTWYYNSCGERGCKKGLTPVGPQLWCDSCEKACEFPLLRFRLRLVVSDETATVVVTLFDETAAALVKKDVSAVLESFGEGDEAAEYPPEILQLVGSKHLLELKSHTYYNHGQYESFTVTRVIPVPETQTPVQAALVVAGANATDHAGKAALGGRKETLGAGGTVSAGKAVLVGTGELPHAGEEHEYLATTVKMPDNKDASCSNPTPEKKPLKRKATSPLSQSE